MGRKTFNPPGLNRGRGIRFPAITRALMIVMATGVVLASWSCSPLMGKLRGKLHIIEGSFFQSQGMYAEAISAYREALGDRESAPYGEYGLGVIYLSLDEGDAALGRYAAAEEALKDLPSGEHGELVYRLHYNRGIAHFQAGDYAAAAAEFRKALESEGSRIEAKRNLELSLLSLNQGGTEQAPLADGGAGEQSSRVLFEYLHQKERDRWKSGEWIEENAGSGPDY